LIDADVNDYEEAPGNGIGTISAHLTASQMGIEDQPKHWNHFSPHVMTPHCHAPSCIREELWNADTRQIICNVSAMYGKPAYGPSSAVFNEADYVAIPPCIFGNQPGLQSPFNLTPGTNITAIKYFNNTYRHLGQARRPRGCPPIPVAPVARHPRARYQSNFGGECGLLCHATDGPVAVRKLTFPCVAFVCRATDGAVDRVAGLRHRPVLNRVLGQSAYINICFR